MQGNGCKIRQHWYEHVPKLEKTSFEDN